LYPGLKWNEERHVLENFQTSSNHLQISLSRRSALLSSQSLSSANVLIASGADQMVPIFLDFVNICIILFLNSVTFFFFGNNPWNEALHFEMRSHQPVILG